MSLLIPKNRRPRFRVNLSIQDLSNVPLVSGLVHVRWHLRDSIRSEARGKTERSGIKDHKVEWAYENSWVARMVIDKDKQLQESIIEFEVYQEMYGGKERHALGKLDLNLAEYADCTEPIIRRYLLQQSKVNSTLKLGFSLEQLSGDTDFRSPDLKKAQVFGGITGLLSEGKEMRKREGDSNYGSNVDSAVEKVAHNLEQDIYRHSLTRQWQARAGELDPADVVDDIFKGGDGWVHPSDQDHMDDDYRDIFDTSAHNHQEFEDHDQRDPSTRRVKDFEKLERQRVHWMMTRQAYEADEMLRSLAWTIDYAQIEERAGKHMQHHGQTAVN